MTKQTGRKVKEKHREDAICNNMYRMEIFISSARKHEKKELAKLEKKEGKRLEKRSEKEQSMQI